MEFGIHLETVRLIPDDRDGSNWVSAFGQLSMPRDFSDWCSERGHRFELKRLLAIQRWLYLL